MSFSQSLRLTNFAVALTVTLALAGCAKNPADELVDGVSGGANGRNGIAHNEIGRAHV